MTVYLTKRGLARELKRNRLAPSIQKIQPAALLKRPDGSAIPLYALLDN
jgi:hypothetical protein